MKIDADEKALLDSVERSEGKSAGGGKRERVRFARYAKGDVQEGPSAEHSQQAANTGPARGWE